MKKRICVIDHPTYLPDLSACDYYLFPELNVMSLVMVGAFYDDIPVIEEAVTQVLKNVPLDDIKKSMHALVDGSKKYIDSNEIYFD